MNTDTLDVTLNEKSVHFFQFAAWSIGAEQDQNGPKSGEREQSSEWVQKKLAGAGARGRGGRSASHRNRFERRAEILPLPLRWHALVDRLNQNNLLLLK